ncbi:putative fatty acyl-CoA reductase CG5065 [Nomia melanderi]|uniref:putative fatty acyl-CoA reductase CG5065 n=1 Tax=Nomia melanderi TaxID=2448451 RepID=UPI00130454BA|nr:putative fatty acyl-CoA reductase CG5065 [Nomia melanderi]XP_031825945.1 putative fatty acyl-CoA reductase CG5065 [Nomia melanderi]
MADVAPPSVAEWYRGRNIFVTGGTGFMGKVLIYKLLLSCHDLENIFVLIRKKKDVDPKTRLSQIIQQQPFKTMYETHPERLKKIILMPGDTTVDDLALSTTDMKRLQEEVSVVFHVAANVKFNLKLKEAIKINTQGTMNVLKLAKQMPNLAAFVHVSTAYCYCFVPVLEEKGYLSSVSPEEVMKDVNNLSDDNLDAIMPKLLEGQPNTYSFSKGLSEELVQNSGLPTAIARPSIVVASQKEPLPGWVENLNGPTGIMVAGGKGVLRSMLCDQFANVHVIPCDIAINVLITLAWKLGIEKPEKTIYMNVTTNNIDNPITWAKVVNYGRKFTREYPFTGVLWYPGGIITTSKINHWFRVVFFQLLPAVILDALIILSGNKPFLLRVQQKISGGLATMQYYTMKQWEFRNDGMKQLEQQLSKSDREEFFMNLMSISWEDFIRQYVIGARLYCLKEDKSSLPRARKVMTYLYYADIFVKIAMFLLVAWFVYSWAHPTRELTTTAFDVNEI